MVQIVVKQSEDDQFLFEAPASSMLDEVIPKIVELHNLRKKIERLTNEIEKLASGKNSEDEENSKEEKKPMLPDTVLQNIDKTIDDARIYLSKVQVERKVVISKDRLNELIELLRACIIIAFPMGLPPETAIATILDNREDLSQVKGIFDQKSAALWWANKELERNEKLSKYVGTNEKTKIIAKLSKKGYGPPPREADKQLEKDMMAFYHRKAEEQKKAEQAADYADESASWANPNELKSAFVGVRNVSWKPT